MQHQPQKHSFRIGDKVKYIAEDARIYRQDTGVVVDFWAEGVVVKFEDGDIVEVYINEIIRFFI